MPEMKVLDSGGIIFVPTAEEQKIADMKIQAQKDLEETQLLKTQAQQELFEVRQMKEEIEVIHRRAEKVLQDLKEMRRNG